MSTKIKIDHSSISDVIVFNYPPDDQDIESIIYERSTTKVSMSRSCYRYQWSQMSRHRKHELGFFKLVFKDKLIIKLIVRTEIVSGSVYLLYKIRRKLKLFTVRFRTLLRLITLKSSIEFNKSKMKFTATVLLLAICVACISAQHNITWGDIINTTLWTEMGLILRPIPLKVRDRAVGFRPVSFISNTRFFFFFLFECNSALTYTLCNPLFLYQFQTEPAIIRGIAYLDFNTKAPATASIFKGGIGQRFAEVRVVSQRGQGVNSTIRFYG